MSSSLVSAARTVYNLNCPPPPSGKLIKGESQVPGGFGGATTIIKTTRVSMIGSHGIKTYSHVNARLTLGKTRVLANIVKENTLKPAILLIFTGRKKKTDSARHSTKKYVANGGNAVLGV